MTTDLHDYEAEELLRKIFIHHAQEVAGSAYRSKLSYQIFPFSYTTRDIVARYLADFEQKVLLRHKGE